MLKIGDSFLLPRNANKTEHLWIVIAKPDENGKAVCVNISSLRSAFCETTVILQPGEHPFIVKKSVVRYADASELDLNKLELALEGNYDFVCAKQEPCSRELLQKIKKGLIKSQHVSPDIQNKCRRSWDR